MRLPPGFRQDSLEQGLPVQKTLRTLRMKTSLKTIKPARSSWLASAFSAVAGLAFLTGGTRSAHAQAVPPTPTPTLGTHAITAFPSRDFVALEGYLDLDPLNPTLTLEVLRGGQVTGRVEMTPDATGFTEVNHPGGYCWGIVPSLGTAVTPDIKGGDVIRVTGIKLVDDPLTPLVIEATPTPFAEQLTVPDVSVTIAPAIGTAPNSVVVHGIANDLNGNGGRGRQLDLRTFSVDIVSPRFSDNARLILGNVVFDSLNEEITTWTATFTNLFFPDEITGALFPLTPADVQKALEGTASIAVPVLAGNGLSTTKAENPAQPGPFALSCNAPLDAPLAMTTAEGLFFTATRTGLAASRSFSVTNAGAGVFGQLHITSMTIEGVDAASFTAPVVADPITIAVAEIQSFTVSMNAATAGEKTATLVIHCDSRYGDIRVPLTGFAFDTDTAPNAAHLVARPATLDMGSRLIGNLSPAYNITVYNLGDAAATGLAASISGPNATDFSIFGAVPTTLAPGDQGMNISLLSEPVAAGPRTATLVISADAISGVVVDLQSIGLEPQAIVEPPATPVTVVVFPGRKFVSADVLGEPVDALYTVQVLRHGEMVSQSPPMLASGGVTEVNHPGAPCWNKVIPDLRPGDRVRLISSVGWTYQTYVADLELLPSPADPTTPVIQINTNTVQLKGRAVNEDGTPMRLSQMAVELVSGSHNQFEFVDGAGQNNANQPIGARAVSAPGNGTLVRDPDRADGFIATFTGLIGNDVHRAMYESSQAAIWLGRGPSEVTKNEYVAPGASGIEGGCIPADGGAPAVLEQPTGDTLLSARKLIFPNLIPGSTFVRSLTIRNPGPGSVTISAFPISGVDAANFTVVGDTCSGIPMLPGDSCTVQVQFNTTGAALGAKTALMTLIDNVAGAVKVPLLGGVVVQPQVFLTANPDAVSFPDTAVNDSVGRRVTIINDGQLASLPGMTVTMTGAGAGQFQTPNLVIPHSIPANGSFLLPLAYYPTNLGAATAAAELAYAPYADAPATVLSIPMTGFSGITAEGFNDPPVNRSILAFYIRDYVSIGGMSLYAMGVVEVVRNGQVIAATEGLFPLPDPADLTGLSGVIELNHIGGECWPTFTPDLAPGDVIRVTETSFTDVFDAAGNLIDILIDVAKNQTYVQDLEVQTGVIQTGADTVEVMARALDARSGAALPAGAVQFRIISSELFANGKGKLITGGDGSVQNISVPGAVEGEHFKAVFTGLSAADVALALTSEAKAIWLGRDGAALEATHSEWGELPGPGAPACAQGLNGVLEFPGEPTRLAVARPTDLGLSGIFTGDLATDPATAPIASIVIRNVGAEDSTITSMSMVGFNPADFIIITATPINILAGRSATVQVQFQAKAEGARSASLRVVHTGDNALEFHSVRGTGIAPPTIASVTPALAQVGDTVTITGTSFHQASAVLFGTTPAAFTLVNTTTITAVVPTLAPGGVYDITVVAIAGTGTRLAAFTVLPPPPVITGRTLPTAPILAGKTVIVLGINLSGVTSVTVGGLAATFVANADGTLSVTIPNAAPASSTIVVTGPTGSATSAAFAVIQPPRFTAANPVSARTGVAVTFTGTGLGFGTLTAPATNRVLVAGVFNATTNPFAITSVTFPTAGGGTVTVPGSLITNVTVTAGRATSVRLTIPATAIAGPITVTGPAGTTTFTGFSVLVTPTVTSVVGQVSGIALNAVGLPITAPVGFRTITVNGSGFLTSLPTIRVAATPSATVGTLATAVTVLSDTQLTAVVAAASAPAGGIARVSVTTLGGTAVSPNTTAGQVTLVSAPTITGTALLTGTTTTRTISGANLRFVNTVELGRVVGLVATFRTVPFTRVGAGTTQQLRIVYPSGTAIGNYVVRVTSLGGTSANSGGFAITTPVP